MKCLVYSRLLKTKCLSVLGHVTIRPAKPIANPFGKPLIALVKTLAFLPVAESTAPLRLMTLTPALPVKFSARLPLHAAKFNVVLL